jgi:ABC-type multidrug transport system ATPase subunit
MRAGELIAEGTVSEILDAVSPDSMVRVHLLHGDDAAAARQILERHSACQEVAATGVSTLAARFDGTPQDRAAVLDLLTASGLQVTEFAVEHPTLEDAYLRVIDSGGQE